jgi:hypothetical protein
MNLQDTIRRILREEIEKKDLSPILEKLLNRLLVKNNKDIICNVKVIHPSQRQSLNNDKFDSYKVTITFIGGEGTEYWPETMAIRDKYESIMNEAWDTIYDFTNQAVDIYSTKVKKCE